MKEYRAVKYAPKKKKRQCGYYIRKMSLKQKSITREKVSHYILIKMLIHQVGVTTLNAYILKVDLGGVI